MALMESMELERGGRLEVDEWGERRVREE